MFPMHGSHGKRAISQRVFIDNSALKQFNQLRSNKLRLCAVRAYTEVRATTVECPSQTRNIFV